MRVRDDPQSLRFSEVRRIVRQDWPKAWLKGGAALGDILLLRGEWGQVGGILCVAKTGRFIALTPGQVWSSEPIPWPEPGAGFSVRIVADQVRLELKEEPEGPRAL